MATTLQDIVKDATAYLTWFIKHQTTNAGENPMFQSTETQYVQNVLCVVKFIGNELRYMESKQYDTDQYLLRQYANTAQWFSMFVKNGFIPSNTERWQRYADAETLVNMCKNMHDDWFDIDGSSFTMKDWFDTASNDICNAFICITKSLSELHTIIDIPQERTKRVNGDPYDIWNSHDVQMLTEMFNKTYMRLQN